MSRYWVGNSGNWDDTAHWSTTPGGAGGASVPTSTDDAIFDTNSITLAGQTITVRNNHTNQCLALDMSNVLNSPTFQFFSNNGAQNVQLSVYGDVTIPASVATAISLTAPAQAIFDFAGTSTQNINIAASFNTSILFQKDASGTFNVTHDLNCGTISFLIGTLTTNNHNINLTGFSLNQGVTLNLGSSVLTSTGGHWFWGYSGAGSTTINAGTSLIKFVGGGIIDINNNNLGTVNLYDVYFNNTGVNGLWTASTGGHFGIHNLTIDPGATVHFNAGTFFINGTLTANGTSGSHITLDSLSSGTSWFIDSPTNSVTVNFCNVQDSHASTTVPFVDVGGNNNGNNVNWKFNTITVRTITGKADIKKTTTRTITGVANILSATTIPQIVNTSDTTFQTTTVQGITPVLNCNNQITGVVYGTNPNPTIADSHVTVASVVGPFFVEIPQLVANTTYYLKPYYLCAGVYTYGQQVIVTTPAISPIQLPATDNLIGQYQIEILDGSNNIIVNLTGYAFNFSFTITRNRPEEILFSVPLLTLTQLANAIHENIQNILNTGINTVRIKRKNQILLAGQLDYWDASFRDPTKPVVNIKAHGWLSLLGYRVFSGEYLAHDANYIMRDIITQTQALTNGNFGITLGASATGTNSYTDKIFENKTISDAFIEFSGEVGGLDFAFTWDKVFNIYHPSMGSQRQDILFTYPGNTLSIDISSDSTKIVNSLLGRGQGNANSNVQTVINDATSQVTYKLRTAVKDFPDISSTDQLVNITGSEVAFYKNPLILHTLTYSGSDPSTPDVGSYSVGDSIRVIVSQLPLYADLLNDFFVIDKQTVSIRDDGFEVVQLDLNNAP